MVSSTTQSYKPGSVIAGRYEVLRCLGTGSMGLVYACKHLELADHIVALKVLYPEVAKDDIASQRFRNEIFASYGVSHPNVVRAYEYIKDGDLVAYSMEYIDGGDLADKLSDEGKLKLDDVLSILLQMSRGVEAIHAVDIVHRDLKPENILLSKEGDVKIADFGIARMTQSAKLTEHGGVVGTIDYVSPEYILNSQLDHRSDIYALGVLAYEMIAGTLPFQGESVYNTMMKRLESPPESLTALRPECPPKLEKIIFKALSVKPEERYQSALEMEEALCELIDYSLHRSEGLQTQPSLTEDATVELQPPMVEKLKGLIAVDTKEQESKEAKEMEVTIEDMYERRKDSTLSEKALNESRRSTIVIENPLLKQNLTAEQASVSASEQDNNTVHKEENTYQDKEISDRKSKNETAYLILCFLLYVIMALMVLQEFFPEVFYSVRQYINRL